MQSTSYLSLGSNLGDRNQNLQEAVVRIQGIENVDILFKSPVLETEPMDVLDQPSFLNQVILVRTALRSFDFLDALQSIEFNLGRIRTIDKGPRTIDIDILTYGDEVIDHPRLQVPHHSILSRPFIRDLMDGCKIPY